MSDRERLFRDATGLASRYSVTVTEMAAVMTAYLTDDGPPCIGDPPLQPSMKKSHSTLLV